MKNLRLVIVSMGLFVSLAASAESKVVFDNKKIQAVVLRGSWKEIGLEAAKESGITKSEMILPMMKQTLERVTKDNAAASFTINMVLSNLSKKIPLEEKEMLAGVAEHLKIPP